MVYLWGGMFHLPLAEDEMYLLRCATINDLCKDPYMFVSFTVPS